MNSKYAVTGDSGVDVSNITSTYSNCYMNREVTLSHTPQINRSLTGSTITNAKWYDVYIYSPTGYGLWGTTQTKSAEKIGQTLDYANCVTVTVTNKWYEDICTINYR